MSYTAIRLTPGMDYSTLVTQANENFTNLENETDIYHTVGEYEYGTPTVAGSTAIPNETAIIPHNLGVYPRFDLFIDAFPRFPGGAIPGFPEEFIIPVNYAMQNFTTSFVFNWFIAADKDNIYVTRVGSNTTFSSAAIPPMTLYYYIYRERIED